MTKEEAIIAQKRERQEILQKILLSKSKRKMIVAGAGTGKTYTFKEILKSNKGTANIAMTFIRLLRDEMEGAVGEYADVRTFHEFCKKILHERRGGFSLYPNLTDIIKMDATHIKLNCGNFDEKFQTIDESGNEIEFYLKRGDYYNTVSFNDSVYRMWRELQKDLSILDDFNQIVIDEFQDFNPLEVAFINELEKKGNILIVGDDDQAVYDARFSTPRHLREKFGSGQYETFELPFCSRCTEVIVKATNSVLKWAVESGKLPGRVEKRYECFIELKDEESSKYPTITTARLTNIAALRKYINSEIRKISPEEIAESWQEGKEYPTVLIVGARQYLNPIYKSLSEVTLNLTFKQSEKQDVRICDGYRFLSQNIKSNLGWRIISNFFLSVADLETIVNKSDDGTPMIDLLSKEFTILHTKIVGIILKFNKENENNDLLSKELQKLVTKDIFEEIAGEFLASKEVVSVPDKSQPSILLTSYQGCKGMSAGFVFIVGANNGVMPRDIDHITDVEICQFVVALTRTRKKCYILSEDWLYSPKDKNGRWIAKNKRS